MIRFPKLYPDLPLPLLGYLLVDIIAVLWVVGCVMLGQTVYQAVMTLSAIAYSVIDTGHRLNNAIGQLEQAVGGLPLIGGDLRHDLRPLHGIPNGLISQGQQELALIHQVALILALVVTIVPLLVFMLSYIPWRVRKTRGFRALNRMLRRPGAHAVSTTMQVLAARALYTLPYDELLHYSPDPLRDWREGRYYNLARATMAREGLDVRRYLRRVEGLSPVPLDIDDDVPVLGDDDTL